MVETAMALELIKKRLPADETAMNGTEEGEKNITEDQSKADAVAPTMAGRSSLSIMRRHSLEHSWTFWFDNPLAKSKHAAWGSSIRAVHTFSTVEDFWGLYNNIQPPSNLVIGADFHCFKHGIEPKWEDPICANGGKWTITCLRGKVDLWWLYTVLAMLGEQFDSGDEICGAVVNVRSKHEKISIWTKNALNEHAQVSIGRQWKELLEHHETIGFIVHDDVIRQDRHAKSRYHA